MKMFTMMFLFAVRYYRTANKSVHNPTANEKLSNANENYRIQIEIIICKWKLFISNQNYKSKWSNANENYRMQMKIIQCKWKITACKWKLSNANEQISNENEKLSNTNEKDRILQRLTCHSLVYYACDVWQGGGLVRFYYWYLIIQGIWTWLNLSIYRRRSHT